MTVQTTSNLSNALRAQYIEDYIRAQRMERIYDSVALPIGKDMGEYSRGSSVVVNFLADLPPSTAEISETADVTPSLSRDATATVTWTSRRDAIQVSEKLLTFSYTQYGKERFEMIGRSMMESVEALSSSVANSGDIWSSYAMTARASLDAAANYYITTGVFTNAQADLETMKVPSFLDADRKVWAAYMHPYVHADLRAATNILATAQYQKANIILAHELGELGVFKLVVSPYCKVFWSAGLANASAVATTIATSATANIALAKTIEVASNTNITVGKWLTIGTIESGNTHYPTNERVRVTATPGGTTVAIAGSGPNGGLRYDHAVGETVSNRDSVAPVLFGGPGSLAKVYNVSTGVYGETVGPLKQGLLQQWDSLGWKWYGNYARVVESRLHRYECTMSRDA